jgi:hypothetical protein
VKRLLVFTVVTLLTIVILLLPMAPAFATSGEYTQISAPFTVDPTQPGVLVKPGSTIHHLSTGVTEVRRPDTSVELTALEGESTAIQTPNGLRKANHLYKVPNEATIDASGNVAQVFDKDGTLILTIIDDAPGQTAVKQAEADRTQNVHLIPAWNGYLEAATGSVSQLDLFNAYWNVPVAPPNTYGSEVNYIFNAIEPAPTYNPIIQPVLSWNLAGYPHRWTGESWIWWGPNWNDGVIGSVVLVNRADLVRGTLTYAYGSQCWVVSFTDMTTGYSSTIQTSSPHNFGTSNLYLLTALEVYNVSNNNDVCGDINFQYMLLTYQGNPTGMQWIGGVTPGSPVTGLFVITYGSDNSRVTLGTPN